MKQIKKCNREQWLNFHSDDQSAASSPKVEPLAKGEDLNSFDTKVQIFLNQFANSSAHFNELLLTVSNSPLFKGVVLIALLWFLWFQPKAQEKGSREIIVTTIASAFIALFFGRLLAFALPFRLRPIFNPDVHLQFPLPDPPRHLSLWSSMPSDHAMLWFAVATGIFLVSKRLGLFAFLYTTVFICLPRIYFGLHFPSDVLVGALLGIGITAVANHTVIRHRVAVSAVRLANTHPAAFYMSSFLFCYVTATQFDEIRVLGEQIIHAFKAAS